MLQDLEDLIAEGINAEARLDHAAAALVGDVLLEAFERLRTRHGVGSETALVIPARGGRRGAWKEEAA